jgi:hypothetical protein
MNNLILTIHAGYNLARVDGGAACLLASGAAVERAQENFLTIGRYLIFYIFKTFRLIKTC